MTIYCDKDRNARKEATLVFRRAELIYDAGNYAYVEADILPADDIHRKHNVADMTQDGNVDRVSRVLDVAYAECVEMLYPYSKREMTDGQAIDDVPQEPEIYEIRLNVPAHFSSTTLSMLGSMMHEYIVCRMVADWMSITNPASEAKWEKKYEALRDKIRSSLVSRIVGARRRLKPF